MNPADLRMLRWALAAALAGTGCGAASIILDFGWAATRAGWMLTAAHCLTWCTCGCLAAVVTFGLLLGGGARGAVPALARARRLLLIITRVFVIAAMIVIAGMIVLMAARPPR